MAFDNLLLERDGRVATLTVNRPKVLNALNAPTLDELRRAALELGHDETVGAVVLTGAGTDQRPPERTGTRPSSINVFSMFGGTFAGTTPGNSRAA